MLTGGNDDVREAEERAVGVCFLIVFYFKEHWSPDNFRNWGIVC